MRGKEVYISPEGDSEINQPKVIAVIEGRGSRVKIKGKWIERGPNYAMVISDPTDGLVVVSGRPAGGSVCEQYGIDDVEKIPVLGELKKEILTALGKRGRTRSKWMKG